MHSDEFHSMITYPCVSCGRQIQETEESYISLREIRTRRCYRCAKAGFKYDVEE